MSSCTVGRAVVRHAIIVTGCLLLLSCWIPTQSALGQEGPQADQLQLHLDAGEFGIAQRLAKSAQSASARDAGLARVAQAQARAGARRASLGSLSDLSSDAARADAVAQVRSASPAVAGRGGAAAADFDTLIELITTTVDPDSWDAVGGPGAIQEFPGGVFIDASGLMRRVTTAPVGLPLDDLRAEATREVDGPRDVRRKSPLRKVSLTRLEKQLQMNWALGMGPDEAMRGLAGLRRVQYVFVYPETRDIVLVGPAGDWRTDAEGRMVGTDDGRPVLQLDDWIVVLRQVFGDQQQPFGCSITPRAENLARTKTFLEASATKPLRPGQRDSWLRELRDHLGEQDIEVFGIDPRTRVARVMVEADYRMKLVGMGLEPGTLGVQSYLDALVAAGKEPADMSMLRWWFTLNPTAIHTTTGRDAFSFDGKSVRVLSENEHITAQGQRVQTGKSDEFAARFAQSFTKQFDKLAQQYPIYAELRNVFDLALVAALLRSEDMPGQIDWTMNHFLDTQRCQIELGAVPREVTTVVSHKMVDQRRFIAGASGGVTIQPSLLVQPSAIKPDTYGIMPAERSGSTPRELPRDAWWWD